LISSTANCAPFLPLIPSSDFKPERPAEKPSLIGEKKQMINQKNYRDKKQTADTKKEPSFQVAFTILHVLGSFLFFFSKFLIR